MNLSIADECSVYLVMWVLCLSVYIVSGSFHLICHFNYKLAYFSDTVQNNVKTETGLRVQKGNKRDTTTASITTNNNSFAFNIHIT